MASSGFDAWEDHRKMRAREAQQREESERREEQEIAERVAAIVKDAEPVDGNSGTTTRRKSTARRSISF